MTHTQTLDPVRRTCPACDGTLWMASPTGRTIPTLESVCRLRLTIVQCHNPHGSRSQHPYRPEEEGAWALPHGEFGLDVIAHLGTLRYRHHRSVPQLYRDLQERQVAIAPRTVLYLLERYEELVALRLADQPRLKQRLQEQGHVILAIDGLAPGALRADTNGESQRGTVVRKLGSQTHRSVE